MAHKTFISYKYSEAQNLRDKIIDSLGDDAIYYNGEDGFSDDKSDNKRESIKKYLANMIYDTSVLIVIISPNMKESEWIDWEIQYALTNNTRQDRNSHTNGVVGVIMEVDGGYDWFEHLVQHSGSCVCRVMQYDESKVYDIIRKNRYNQNLKQYKCDICESIDALNGSYIAYVEEKNFLANPSKYIENAYNKSENDASRYNITKTR